MKPLAIIGLSPETHDDAPWEDETWERWGLPWDVDAPRCHFLFEIHDPGDWGKYYTGSATERMREIGVPVYLQAVHDDVPLSLEYPLDEVVKYLGRDYFGSSLAYPLALAIMHRRRIGLWGMDLSDAYYDHQRHNLAWLLGHAEARGLTLEGPNVDTILALSDDVKGWGYPKRYGWTAAA